MERKVAWSVVRRPSRSLPSEELDETCRAVARSFSESLLRIFEESWVHEHVLKRIAHAPEQFVEIIVLLPAVDKGLEPGF